MEVEAAVHTHPVRIRERETTRKVFLLCPQDAQSFAIFLFIILHQQSQVASSAIIVSIGAEDGTNALLLSGKATI